MKIYHPDKLALYLLGTSIGVNKARESCNFRAAKGLQEWAVRVTNAKRECIDRLVRILCNNSLEEVFGYKVTMSMLHPLRYH